MARQMNLLVSLLLLFAAAATVSAQSAGGSPQKQEQPDAYLIEHKERRAKNPEGLSFTVRLKDNRTQFHHGEMITLELGFASSKPDAFRLDAATYDRSGRLHSDGFALDPRDPVDPLQDYFSFGTLIMGGLRSIPDLTDKPYLITADLNEWRRIDKPGHYRLYVVSSRVGRKGGGRSFLDNAGSPVISNVIEFDVLPPDEKWSKRKLSEIVAALSKPGEGRQSACRALRFLGTTAAVSEITKRFRGDDRSCEWEYKFGLIGSPHRDFVIREMESAISLREQPVTSHFIDTLTRLEFAKRAGDEPGYPGEQNEETTRRWQSEMDQRERARSEVRLHYLRQLMLALPQKQGYARATSLQTLLDYRGELNTRDFANWTTLLASISEVFNRLPPDEQSRLLTYQWKPIASAAMLPVLREVLKYPDDPKQDTVFGGYHRGQLRSIALHRLHELSPEEGRRLILEEIRLPRPRMTREVLRSLPDETLPELNTVLLNNLEESRRGDSFYTDVISELIERYATDEIFSRVRAVYETRVASEWPCRTQAALLAYFLRVSPAAGGEYLKKALESRRRNYPRCHTEVLKNVAELHMSAEVEAAAIPALDDQEAEVVTQAAGVLAAHGSADAEKPLWRRFEKWQRALQSRSEEITEDLSLDQKNIEQALRDALTGGGAWLSDPAKLKRVRDLCVTEGGRVEVNRLIDGWNTQIEVVYEMSDNELSGIRLAQYGMKSFDGLKQRLLQFPKGTVFTLKTTTTRGGDAPKSQEVLEQIKTYLEDHGMKLKQEPEQ